MRKKIIFILLALIMLGTIAYFYVNRILLPEVHARIESRLSEQLNRPVTIGQIRLEPDGGFRLHNVLVKEPGTARPFAQVDEIACTVLLAPFLREKTLVIPNITIRKPIARIVQAADGSFNFSDLLQRPQKSKKDGPPQVFVTHVKVMQGAIDYVRQTPEGDFSENFRDVGIDLSLSMDRQIDFRLKTVLPFDSTAIEASGRYTLGSKSFYAEVKASQFNFVKYQRQFFPLEQITFASGELATCDLRLDYLDKKLKVSGEAFFSGIHMEAGDRRYGGELRLLNTNILLDRGALTARGEIRLPAVNLELGPDQKFEGDLQLFVESLTKKEKDWFVSGNIKARNITLGWPGGQSLRTHLLARDATLSFHNKQLSVLGNFDFEDARYQFGSGREFAGQVFAKNLSLKRKDGEWSVKSAVRSERTRLSFGKSELVNSTLTSNQLTIRSDPQALTVEGSLATQDAVFSFGESVKFQGSPQINLQYRRPRDSPDDATFTGDLTFYNGLLFGLPRVETLSNLQGGLRLTRNGAVTEKIRFTVANTHVTLAGRLEDWSQMTLDASASTPSVELARVTGLVPEIFEKYAIDLDGRTALRLNFRGSALAWKDGDLNLEAELIDSRLSGEKIPGEFSGLNGKIRYSRDRVAWSDLKAVYKDFPFAISGQLENFSRPVIETTLSAEDLQASARINLLNKTIRVPSVSAKYHNSDMEGSADIYFISGQAPEIQINGRGTVYASDISSFLPQFKDRIAPLALSGIFDTKMFFKGKPGDSLNWSIDVDAKSDRITVKNHPLTDVKITYLQRDKNISKLNFNADAYGGKIKFDSSANLENRDHPFVMALGIYDTDLAKFIAVQQPGKKNNLAGTFSLNLGLEGELKKRRGWSGQGNYKIVNGYIWDFQIIKMLNKILLIKEFIRTVYTDSSADFRIADGKIGTENLKLKSETISLLVKGYIAIDQDVPLLDQKISLDVYPSLSEITRIQSEDDALKKFTTVMVSKTLNIIKVTGTLRDPQKKIVATQIPTNIFKGTIDTIKGVGESLIESIIGP